MLNKLRNINNKLINYYKDNDIEYKKQLKIKNILIENGIKYQSLNSLLMILVFIILKLKLHTLF